MQNVTVRRLMDIEKELLEIDLKGRYTMPFKDALRLRRYLTEIGEITDYSFYLQHEYSREAPSENDMSAFHDRIMDSDVEYDVEDVCSFIKEMKKCS